MFFRPTPSPNRRVCRRASPAAHGLGRRRAAIGFIFATALMDMMAIGIVIPVLPQLVKHFTHGDVGEAAGYVGLYSAVWALMQFIFSPVQGALSDHFGRRPRAAVLVCSGCRPTMW